MKTLHRSDSIQQLRARLLQMVDDEHSICDVAARAGIICQGFKHWSDDELKQTFHWLSGPELPREQIERRANAYLLGRTATMEQRLACDAQEIEKDVCLGWDEFSNEDLARFHQQLFGEDAKVVDDPDA